jgi:hypothetical protein
MCEWAEPRHEPPLAEILAEPVIRAVMRRDGVEPGEIMALLEGVRQRSADEKQAQA